MESRRRRMLPNAPERCREVGSLYDLVERYPALREVMRRYNPRFVTVLTNTCTLPQASDGRVRDDCVVYGLFFVDRAEARRPASDKLIRQDYFVVWTDGSGEMRYYSGAPLAWRRSRRYPIHWRDVDDFCLRDGFAGSGGCYGCEPSPQRNDPHRPKHWYRENDPELPRDPEPIWRLAFALAIAVARQGTP